MENQQINRNMDKIQIKAAFVVQLIDDFSEETISGADFTLFIEKEKKPIYKPEGYYVFTHLLQKEFILHINSFCYNRESILITLDDKKSYFFLKVRLKPNKNYKFYSGITCVEGKTMPDEIIYLYLKHTKEYKKLLCDLKKDKSEICEEIFLYNPEKKDLEGKIFLISNQEENTEELIELGASLDSEFCRYRLKKTLLEEFKKTGTKLFPVYTAKSDKMGWYFIPIRQKLLEKQECDLEFHGAKIRKKKIILENAGINLVINPQEKEK